VISIHWRCDFVLFDLLPVTRLIFDEDTPSVAFEIGWLCFGFAIAWERGAE